MRLLRSSRVVTDLLVRVSDRLERVVIAALRGYQFVLSPLFAALGSHCRFEPSCSQYMIDAVKARGAMVGVGLGLWRLARCNPLNAGGYDPVPARSQQRNGQSILGEHTEVEQGVSRETT